MSTFGEIATEVFTLINDSEYDLDRAYADVAQAVREIENLHTFEYMDFLEQRVKSQNYFMTGKVWKRPSGVKLYIQRGSDWEFAHLLKYRANLGDRVPVNALADKSVPENADNRATPYWYSFGQLRNISNGSLGYAAGSNFGREILLWPEPDSDNLYMVEIHGYAYSSFDLESTNIADEVHWLFDHAKNAVVAQACVLSVKFTDDRGSLSNYLADFEHSTIALVSSDIELQESESDDIAMEYQGENPSYNDTTGTYPPDSSRSRVIYGEGN